MPSVRRLIRAALVAAVLLTLSFAGAAAAERSVLAPVADATLVESADGSLADGSGVFLRAGRTGQNVGGTRRAVLRFDIAGTVPRGATVVDAALVIEAAPSGAGPRVVAAHRLLRSWSEGPTLFNGGQGAPAVRGDVTWVHRTFDTRRWDAAGGDFAADPSAAVAVDGAGAYAWRDAGLVADVQRWVDRRAREHGWILIGDESERSTAKKLVSREAALPALPPLLIVDWEPAEDDDSDSSSDDD